jgi:hypothetical protein
MAGTANLGIDEGAGPVRKVQHPTEASREPRNQALPQAEAA